MISIEKKFSIKRTVETILFLAFLVVSGAYLLFEGTNYIQFKTNIFNNLEFKNVTEVSEFKDAFKGNGFTVEKTEELKQIETGKCLIGEENKDNMKKSVYFSYAGKCFSIIISKGEFKPWLISAVNSLAVVFLFLFLMVIYYNKQSFYTKRVKVDKEDMERRTSADELIVQFINNIREEDDVIKSEQNVDDLLYILTNYLEQTNNFKYVSKKLYELQSYFKSIGMSGTATNIYITNRIIEGRYAFMKRKYLTYFINKFNHIISDYYTNPIKILVLFFSFILFNTILVQAFYFQDTSKDFIWYLFNVTSIASNLGGDMDLDNKYKMIYGIQLQIIGLIIFGLFIGSLQSKVSSSK